MTVEQVDKHGVARENAFVHASMRTRITLALAGPAVNLVLAWVGLTVAAFGLAPHGTPVWKLILLSPVIGAVVLWRAFGMTVTALAHTITGSFSDVHSVIALPHVLHSGVDQAATTGIPVWAVAVALFGLINLSLAVVNALPLYPLDGYHALLAVIDGVRRSVARRHGRTVGPLARAQMSWYTRTTGVAVGLFSAVLLGRDLVSLFNGTLP